MNLHPTEPDIVTAVFEGKKWHLKEWYGEEDNVRIIDAPRHTLAFDFEDDIIIQQHKLTRKTVAINLPFAKKHDMKTYNKFMEEKKLWRKSTN